MSKKKNGIINGRFREPDKPGASIIVWGVLAVALLETVIFAIPCGYMCLKRLRARTLAERFVRFAKILGMRRSVTVGELARAENWTEDSVRRDLRKMIELGWFGPGAYMNQRESTLIIPMRERETQESKWAGALRDLFREMKDMDLFRRTAESVQKSAQTPASQPKPQAQPAAAPKEQPAVPKEKTVRNTYIEELEHTLNELYELNRQIEDEAVSARIDRIGTLTTGIFRVVIQNPDREVDVRKFMNYYLPTTLKLLKSYDLLEDDRVQSANITESRQKIERMLDKLIEAFEQLHDRLYSTDTLDLDTDIEVLETMMAKDGLSSKGRIQMPSH